MRCRPSIVLWFPSFAEGRRMRMMDDRRFGVGIRVGGSPDFFARWLSEFNPTKTGGKKQCRVGSLGRGRHSVREQRHNPLEQSLCFIFHLIAIAVRRPCLQLVEADRVNASSD